MKFATILTTAIAVLFAATLSASAERRLALVIGNGSYQHTTRLPNPVNDAQAISNKLAGLGFEIHEGYDLDKAGMDRVLRNFARSASESDLNVFFYAGHGMSVDGTNYLVPVDARFEDQTSLDFEAIAVDFVTRQMSISDAVNLVFLDACRDNPLSRSLSRSMGATRSAVGGGLSEMKIASPGKGMAISFATSPGEVALDGEGNNSPFTQALLRHLDAENTDIAEVFSRVTGDVYEQTNQAQRPWQNVSLTGPVVLNPVTRLVQPTESANTESATAPSSSDMLEEQKILFGLARETGAVEDYQAYLDSFPNGLFANNARRMIRSLQGSQTAALGGTTNVERTTGGSNGNVNLAASIDETGPLVLPITNNLRGALANQGTEQALDLDRKQKGDIQAMLNASGHNVGGVDGRWGNKTRNGISNWQLANGLVATSYLNAPQLELLRSQTHGRYTPYTPPKASNKTRKTSKKRSRKKQKVDPGAVLLGVAAGILLSK